MAITIKDVVYLEPPQEIIERGRASGHKDWETSKHMREKAIVNAGLPINNEKGKAAESVFIWHFGLLWADRCMQFHNGLGDVSILHVRVATVHRRGDYKSWPIRIDDDTCLIGPWAFMWCYPGDFGRCMRLSAGSLETNCTKYGTEPILKTGDGPTGSHGRSFCRSQRFPADLKSKPLKEPCYEHPPMPRARLRPGSPRTPTHVP